jgi:hypothetical protein
MDLECECQAIGEFKDRIQVDGASVGLFRFHCRASLDQVHCSKYQQQGSYQQMSCQQVESVDILAVGLYTSAASNSSGWVAVRMNLAGDAAVELIATSWQS